VLNTLKGLRESGDTVISIEGILSGTLSYIFNTWKAGSPFSQAVLEAKELGYTEPDPREDLAGMDVARKVHCHAIDPGRLLKSTLQLCLIKPTQHSHKYCFTWRLGYPICWWSPAEQLGMQLCA
jgi:hypothetical protein